ncbi:MAG: phosphonate C-P lyase system protein PhnG [Rhodospirillales bacterium]
MNGMQSEPPDLSTSRQRQRWMTILAKTSGEDLEALWERFDTKPAYRFLRPPETGLAMVRGRAGGTGQPFNLGEASITRCAVHVSGGAAGFAVVLGRDERKAELAAVFDALLLDPSRNAALERDVVKPLEDAIEARRRACATKAAATKVDFFTLVRGED